MYGVRIVSTFLCLVTLFAHQGIRRKPYSTIFRRTYSTQKRISFSKQLKKAQAQQYSLEYSWVKIPLPPQQFWTKERLIQYREHLGKQLKLTNFEDWYQLNANDLNESEAGRSLLKLYNGSVHRVVEALFPEHLWLPWRFVRSYNPREFVPYATSLLGFTNVADWYSVTIDVYALIGGSRGHIERYGGMYGLCSHLFPSHQWNPYLFRIRDGYWKRKENVKAYISWLFKELGLKRLDDWYQVSGEQFVANGGVRPLIESECQGSLYKALKLCYPKHNWNETLFVRSPTAFWADIALRRNVKGIQMYIEQLEREFMMRTSIQWYTVIPRLSAKDMIVFNRLGGIANVLPTVYPYCIWDIDRIVALEREYTLRLLRKFVEELFPHKEILEDYTFENTKFSLFLPELKLAFVYLDSRHYFAQSPNFIDDFYLLQQDVDRNAICMEKGITLIEVGYHWNQTRDSLAATINERRLELQLSNESHAEPIPPIPDTKHHLTQLAPWKLWNTSINYPLVMTEHYEGVRVMWDGTCLRLPTGRRINIPHQGYIPETLSLDGVLWAGYETPFEELCEAVKAALKFQSLRNPSLRKNSLAAQYDHIWRRIRFVVYDVLNFPKAPTLNRLRLLDFLEKRTSNRQDRWIIIPPRRTLESPEGLKQSLKEVLSKGGAGVRLSAPDKPYNAPDSVFIEKPLIPKTVKIVGVFRGTGLICKQNDGGYCLVQAPQSVLQNPPPPETTIVVQTSLDDSPVHEAVLLVPSSVSA